MAKSKSNTEFIYHYVAARLRVTGSGNLLMRLISVDAVKEKDFVPLVMQVVTDRNQTKLINFKQETAQLEIKTTEIDEYFEIDKIMIFVKPIASSYPL